MTENTSIIKDNGRRELVLPRVKLKVMNGVSAGAIHTFERDVIQIGASDNNDLIIKDQTVSRAHAEVVRTPDGLLLRDLNSTNGTWVGAIKVQAVYLGEQRVFRVGRTELELSPDDQVVSIEPTSNTSFDELVGGSVVMRELFTVLDRVAPTELTVLTTGETGTGKELVAKAIHRKSRRSDGPFIVFDCGAVPPNLIESELFGHERGAFTGAVAPRPGVFEAAHGGTIFIDELGEMPLSLQSTLLRVLEQREVRRVGARKTRKIDVRVVAATNRNLHEMVQSGAFRSDLYYRLAVVELVLPPLRDRGDDIDLLLDHLLRNTPFEHTVVSVDPLVKEVLRAWSWPGNIRELRNVVHRAVPFCADGVIRLKNLPGALVDKIGDEEDNIQDFGALDLPTADENFHDAKDRLILLFEQRYLSDLLERADGNLTKAAKIAGIDRKTVARLIKRHGIR